MERKLCLETDPADLRGKDLQLRFTGTRGRSVSSDLSSEPLDQTWQAQAAKHVDQNPTQRHPT